MADIIISKLVNECKNDVLNYAISMANDFDRIVIDIDITTGIVFLKNNIEIHIVNGRSITASSNIDDFKFNNESKLNLVTRPTWEDCSYDGAPSMFFFYGKGLSNVKFTGEGIIDGNEEIFYGRVTKDHIEGKFYPRVPMIYLINSSNIILKDITLTRSAFWTVHLVGDRNVVVDNVKIINSRIFANCDGIDIDSCNNVTVKNCNISAADDCIVLKSTKEGMKYGDCHNIRGFNNVLASTSAAIKIGSETESNFYDIKFYDNRIYDSNRGISFQLRDKGLIYDVTFRNISIETHHFSPLEWWGKAEPIFISCNRRYKNSLLGNIRDIKFSNITINSENSIYLYGDIKNVIFKNVSMRFNRKTDYDLKLHDIRPSEEFNGPLASPLNLITIDSASDITFKYFNYLIEDNIKDEVDELYSIKGNNIVINNKSF